LDLRSLAALMRDRPQSRLGEQSQQLMSRRMHRGQRRRAEPSSSSNASSRWSQNRRLTLHGLQRSGLCEALIVDNVAVVAHSPIPRDGGASGRRQRSPARSINSPFNQQVRAGSAPKRIEP
jgi:hypothetical protein